MSKVARRVVGGGYSLGSFFQNDTQHASLPFILYVWASDAERYPFEASDQAIVTSADVPEAGHELVATGEPKTEVETSLVKKATSETVSKARVREHLCH